jgi:hypothetical protein
MEMIALGTLCIGGALGLRFKVFILIPAILAGVAVITAWGLTQGASIGTISVMNVIGAAGLQFGYLGSTLIGSLTSAGRLGAAKNSQSARPFAP